MSADPPPPSSKADLELVLALTAPRRPPLVPELVVREADSFESTWARVEEVVGVEGLTPPFWAFAWAGGQALSRYVLDHSEVVARRRVLSFSCGGGVETVAAARAGATIVWANDIDPIAMIAVRENARCNGVSVEPLCRDLLEDAEGWLREHDPEVILAGDILYEAALARRVTPWLFARAAEGRVVLLGDCGRKFAPEHGLEPLASYRVETPKELEGVDHRIARVWRMRAP